MKRKKIKRIVFGSIAAVLVLVGLAFGFDAYHFFLSNFKSLDGQQHGIYVYPDTPLDSVLNLVGESYQISSAAAFRRACRKENFTTPRPGYYEFGNIISNRQLVRRLRDGRETPVRLSWTNSVRTREQLAKRLADQLMLDSATIAGCLGSDAYMESYALNRETAVCLFIPNTYEVYWSMSVDQLFDRMFVEYNRFWTDQRLQRAENIGFTPTEVATLASIVESETNRTAEHPIIAGLYINRLHKGMPLQACPTVIFANGDFSVRRVQGDMLRINSPYNTYRFRGLPPGPIRCPNGATIDAVLNYDHNDYLYMCANPDFSGNHKFSRTYAEHAATARQYQRELNKRNIN